MASTWLRHKRSGFNSHDMVRQILVLARATSFALIYVHRFNNCTPIGIYFQEFFLNSLHPRSNMLCSVGVCVCVRCLSVRGLVRTLIDFFLFQRLRLVRERKRVAWILLLLAVLFALCWLPYNILQLLIDVNAVKVDSVSLLLPYTLLLGKLSQWFGEKYKCNWLFLCSF